MRDGVLQGASDTEDLGFAVRVVHGGAWGFASGVVLTADEAVRVAETAVAVARVAAEMTSRPVELAAEPTYDDVEWVSAYEIDPFEVPVAEKAARAHRLDQPAAHRRRRRPRLRPPAAGAREQVLRRPQRHPHHPAAGPARSPGFEAMGAGRRHLRLDGEHRPAGRPRLGVPHRRRSTAGTGTPRSSEVPELLAEKLKAPSVEAGSYDLVIHPSNLWLTIHESIGHATELDRALGYEANYAGTSFATFDKLSTLQYGSAGHERHRRPHRRARPGHDRVRRRGRRHPELGHRQGRRLRRLPARPVDGRDAPRARTAAAPTAARTPTPPATSRSSGWPTCRCSRRRTARAPRS